MKINTFFPRALSALASQAAFWWIVGLLVFQAAWIALTAHYPQAFDENFHLGIIRIYAQHLSPFLSSQPAGADAYGAVARDPSYLYHYLFSFPYRLIDLFTHNQTVQVIILRCLNIGLFVSGLILYRQLFKKLRAPQAVVNGSLLLFVLIPVVPLLAGQINYDNLFIPAVISCLLLAHKFVTTLRVQRFDSLALVWLGSVCCLTSLVKYAFLPIFLAIGLWLIVAIIRYRRPSLWRQIVIDMQTAKRWQLGLAGLLLIIASGMFAQRYAINTIRYHTPLPDCAQVLTIKQCSSYGPWVRDYNLAMHKTGTPANRLIFSGSWLYGMWLRLYFAVDGPTNNFQTRGPLRVPALSAIIIAGGGLVILVIGVGRVFKRYDRPLVLLLATTAAIYILTLFTNNYQAYVRTGGVPVAINGRYLLPFLPILFVLVGLASRELLAQYRQLVAGLVVVIIASQLWGGGVLTYILRSNDNWYWPSAAAHSVNHAVQRTLGPVTPGYDDPTEFLH